MPKTPQIAHAPLDDLDHAQMTGSLALQFLARYQVPPLPEHYAVAFAFASGRNPMLVRALDELLKRGEPLHATQMGKLHQEFVEDTSPVGEFRAAGHEVEIEIQELVAAVTASDEDVKTFGRSLNDASKTLARSEPKVADIVAKLIAATKNMAGRNAKLEQKLKASSSKMEKMKRRMETLQHSATTDKLTGLLNRHAFDESLAVAQNQSRMWGKPFALLLVDVDRFKGINDTYGHVMGDQVLRLVAKTVAMTAPPEAIVARYGGEEFAVIFQFGSATDVSIAAQRIREAVQAKRVTIRGSDEEIACPTVSIGAGVFHPGETEASFVERVDAALYRAKNEGRNRVEMSFHE